MANFRIDQFKGIMPRVEPSLLPPGCATVANNLILKDGKILPLKDPESLANADIRLENGMSVISNAKTIYPWRRKVNGSIVTTFLAWPGEVTVAKTNIADDDRDRIFVSGSTGIPHSTSGANHPSVYFNNRSDGTIVRRTLIKTAMSAPVVSVNSGSSGSGTKRYTYFYQTWVDKYGYESPASTASEMIEYYDGDSIHIGAYQNPDSQAVTRRIYKTITGDQTEDNRFVIEWSDETAFGAHDFAILDELAGEKMPVIEAPPTDLESMLYVPGAYYVGFAKSIPHTIMFSDTSLPYSWPTKYQYDIHDNIVGLAVTKNTVFAMTDNCVWCLRGTDPDSMVASALSPAACVSKRSICVFKNNVFFATNYGLAMVYNDVTAGDVVTNVTDKFFTKEQWQALNPSTCHITEHDGRLMVSFSSGNYIVDLNETENMVTTHSVSSVCECVDGTSDDMFFVKPATTEVQQ